MPMQLIEGMVYLGLTVPEGYSSYHGKEHGRSQAAW